MSEFSSSDEDTIQVLVNECYGGFSLSEQAKKVYAERTHARDASGNLKKIYDFTLERHDPILVQIYNEFKQTNETFHGSCAKINAVTIPKKYEFFYTIDEYDGKEGLRINHKEYILDQIHDILKRTDINNDKKVGEMEKLDIESYLGRNICSSGRFR
jgi:hypothetical protein